MFSRGLPASNAGRELCSAGVQAGTAPFVLGHRSMDRSRLKCYLKLALMAVEGLEPSGFFAAALAARGRREKETNETDLLASNTSSGSLTWQMLEVQEIDTI